MTNLTIGGIDPRTNQPFTYYETTAGGMGARPTADGISGVHTHMTNSLNTPIEALEYAYPLPRPLATATARTPAAPAASTAATASSARSNSSPTPAVTLLTDRRIFPPYGLDGGHPGAPGRSILTTPGAAPQELPGKCSSKSPPAPSSASKPPAAAATAPPPKPSRHPSAHS